MNSSLRDSKRLRAGETRPSGAASLIPPDLDALLVLLRHGQTQFIVDKRFQGAMEAPLTALGEEQASLAGRRMALPGAPPAVPIPESPPFAIVHSPLGRARRSTELAVEAMTAEGRSTPPLRSDAGFSEISQGVWEGLTDEEITAQFGDSLAKWRRWPTRFHAPGGETLEAASARASDALSTLLRAMAAGATPGTLDRHQVLGYEDAGPDLRRWSLIVGHGGIFRVVACLLLGLSMEHFWNFDFGLGAISVVEIRSGRAVMRALNLNPSLGVAAAAEVADSMRRDAGGAL